MAVQVLGSNHLAIEVDDAQKAVAFYEDVFNLTMLKGGGGLRCQLGEHQFLAIFEVDEVRPDRWKHFGLMVRDEDQLREVREKVTQKYGLTLEPEFRCDFRDPSGQPHSSRRSADESRSWLLPYRRAVPGIEFGAPETRPRRWPSCDAGLSAGAPGVVFKRPRRPRVLRAQGSGAQGLKGPCER